mmetsp:Transcript_15984/g.30140  ORF Transcript_15984/g.30140 Transcript_15984/m.30140 type:complete len:238 (-) Transcript_15984:456-1169(-)
MTTGEQSIVIRKEHLQRQAVLMQRKVTALIAFTTTIFLLCIENVKAFAAPFSSPDTLMMLATGAHSLAKRWKNSNSCSHSTDHKISSSSGSPNTVSTRPSAFIITPRDVSITRSQSKSTSSLRMAFGFGVPAASPPPSPTVPDMKVSTNTFGFWYNQMDPVARPPVYDDDVTDYTFTSPSDSWPSLFDDNVVASLSVSSAKKSRRPRPIRAIRKIAGWVFGSPAGKNARGFGAQSFL